MKKQKISIPIIIFLFYSLSFSTGEFSYSGAGIGGQISFVTSEWHGPAFGFGFQGVIEFSVGRIGSFQYIPSLCLWFNSDERVTIDTPNRKIEWNDHKRQVALNFSDIKYIFPIPQNLVVRPYGGLGFCIVINGKSDKEIETDKSTGEISRTTHSGRDSDPGFNMFAGVDFRLSKKVVPYVETRFTACPNWVFRLTGGLTFLFK